MGLNLAVRRVCLRIREFELVSTAGRTCVLSELLANQDLKSMMRRMSLRYVSTWNDLGGKSTGRQKLTYLDGIRGAAKIGKKRDVKIHRCQRQFDTALWQR